MMKTPINIKAQPFESKGNYYTIKILNHIFQKTN